MGGKRMIDNIVDEYVYINLSDSDINTRKNELSFVINKKEFLKLYLQILIEDIPENMHKLITLFYKEFPGLKNKPALTVFFNLYLLKSLYIEHENNRRCDNHGKCRK